MRFLSGLDLSSQKIINLADGSNPHDGVGFDQLSSYARTTAAYTTGSLASGGTETGTITMAKGYRLYKITTSAAARVRLYGKASQVSPDAARAWGTDPGAGVGLMLDYLTVGAVTENLSPLVDGFNDETSPTTAIPISITATAAGAITVTFTYIQTE